MARETWVAANRRALGLALLLPASLFIVGLGICLTSSSSDRQRTAGLAIVVLSTATFGFVIWKLLRPRVAYHAGHVEFFLRRGAPVAVPLEHVEAFLLGQGSALLPANVRFEVETLTLVARLSRRAEEWSHVDVNPALGRWCDGYVTIRGMWCEPLTIELVNRLNRRLHEVKHEHRAETLR